MRRLLASLLLSLCLAPGSAPAQPRTLAVTDDLLAALERMAAWGAAALDVRGPGPGFREGESAFLQSQLATMPAADVAAYASATRTTGLLDPIWARSSPRWKQLFIPKARAGFLDPRDPTEPHRLAGAVAGLAAEWSRTGGPPVFEAQLNGQTQTALGRMRATHDAGVAMSGALGAAGHRMQRWAEPGCLNIGGDAQYQNSSAYCHSLHGAPNVNGGVYGR